MKNPQVTYKRQSIRGIDGSSLSSASVGIVGLAEFSIINHNTERAIAKDFLNLFNKPLILGVL